MNEFVKNGALTPDGQKVVDYLNEAIKPALEDPNPNVFNSLSGAVKHFGVNVVLGQLMTSAQWLEDYNYSANVLLDNIAAAEAQQQVNQQATETAAAVKSISEQFDEMKKLLAEQAVELAALKEAKPEPKGKKAKPASEPETDAEEDAE